MKTAIKLVLIYFLCQILGAFLGIIYGIVYSLVAHGNIDIERISPLMIVPSMFLGFVFMCVYLWKYGYLSKDKEEWSPVSAGYLVLTVIIFFASVILIDYVMSLLPALPNLLEATFNNLTSNWFGILCLAVLGPILEELLFRGAITKVLLRKYNPTKAIILSALVFGVFHINPAQIVSATLIGLLLGWIYYKTASLVPCILVHILNNSLSVYLSIKYPEVESTKDMFSGNTYLIIVAGAVVVFAGAYFLMKSVRVPYRWKEGGL